MNLFLGILTILAFSISGPAAAIALKSFSIGGVVGGRCLLAALTLLFVLRKQAWFFWRALDLRGRKLTLIAGFVFGLHLLMFVAGIGHTSFAAAVCFVALEPIVVLLTGILVFGARPRQSQVIGISIAIAGAVVIGLGGARPIDKQTLGAAHSLKGDLIMLGAVFLYGFYYALNRSLEPHLSQIAAQLKPGRGDLGFAAVVYGVAGAVALMLAQMTGFFGLTPEVPVSVASCVAVLALALLPTLVGHTLIQVAARRLAPVWVALMSPGESLGSIIIGAIFFGTRPSWSEWVGGSAILVGAAVVAIRAVKKPSDDVALKKIGRNNS